MTLEIVDLARQRFLDRAPDAAIEEGRLVGAVEIAVEIRRVFGDLDIAVGQGGARR
jgi:hypothetical protein